ncbi:methyl-accepting chemotaxis protein [Clostridium ihumii]|uniref:methyl-accepting chemotaxis protein n=1 Tax=Clostridium ihumii TaxID=1470356 RepID=UPI00058D2147|nr:methyl-accepting chemotaxis protein [Clostridium ihumii]
MEKIKVKLKKCKLSSDGKAITKQSISKKLVTIFTSIIMVISISMAWIAISISDKSHINMANQDYEKLLVGASSVVREKINNKLNVLQNLSLDDDLKDKNTSKQHKVEILEKYAEKNNFIRLGITDTNGDLLFLDSKVDISKREYFKDVLNGEASASDPMKSVNKADNGAMVIVYASPIMEGNQVVGAIVGVAAANEYSDIVTQTNVGKSGSITIFDKNGIIVANKDGEGVGEPGIVKGSAEEGMKLDVEIGEKILAGEHGYGTYKNSNNKQMFTVYGPMEGTTWYVSLQIEKDEILHGIKVMRNAMGIIAIIFLITGVLIVYNQTKKMSAVLNKTVLHLDNIADGDMTLNFDEKILKRQDEFGDMTRAMEKMQKSISGMIENINGNTLKIENHASNLAQLSNEMTTSSNTVANAIQDVAKGTDNQSNDINNIVDVLTEFNEKIEEVMTSTNEIGDESRKIHTLSNESNEEMESVSTSVKNVTVSFEELVEKVNNVEGNVNKINEITVIINGIAEQTNLLALNAAIEAARVGEAGKGFAVVADEIRKLAEQSKISAADINTLLTTVFNETTAMVGMTEVVQDEIKSQEEIINKAIVSFDKINNAVEEMKPKIEKNMEIGQAILEDKDDIMVKIQNASAVSEEVSASAEEISAISEEMDASTSEVAEHSKVLAEMTKEMKAEVERFKI